MGKSTSLAEVWDRSQSAPTENLSSLLCRAAEQHATRTAVVSLHQPSTRRGSSGVDGKTPDDPISWTYSQLRDESIRLAHWFSARGVTPGTCIATVLFNQIEWALVFWAAAHLGCQFVAIDYRAVNHKEQARELLGRISCSAIVVANPQLASAVDEAIGVDNDQKSLRCVVDGPRPNGWLTLAEVSEAVKEQEASNPSHSPASPTDTAVIFFTSGTTGSSKACPHSATTLYSVARGLSKAHFIDERRTICQHLPGFHIFSVVYSVAAWLHGAEIVYPSPSFDADSTVRAIMQSTNVVAPCVPLIIQALVKSPSRPEQFDPLETITLGGSTVYPELIEACMSLQPKRIAAGYSMSESLVVASRNLPAKDALVGADEDVCLGTATSGSCIRICAPESRRVLSRGEVGEVHLGGLPVFEGYLGLSHESCYHEDGTPFIITGDQGYLDEQGRLYVLGRYKDLIIRGGENISPPTIERYLARQLGVTAQIVGVPDDVAGEAVVAVTQQSPDIEVERDEIRNSVAKDLGQLFMPSTVLNLIQDLGQERFPATPSGKPQKATLQRWVKGHLQKTQDSQLAATDGSLESQLTNIWAALSGCSADRISPDISVATFTDSMMAIQFRSIIFDRLRKNISSSELADHTSIQSQVKLLDGRHEMPKTSEGAKSAAGASQAWKEMPENQEMLPGLQQVSEELLAEKGLQWSEVEDVFPKPDIIGPMAKGARPNSWNHRHSMIVRNCEVGRVTTALRTWLESHPLMRSLTVHDGSHEFYLILPAQDKWLQHQIFEESGIDHADELLTYRFNELDWDCASPPGPFFKVTILPIRQTSDVGLIFHWHHAIFDGVIIRQWYRELGQILKSQKQSATFYSFQRFAAAVYGRSQNKAARKAVDYHVNSLRGIGAARNALWPPQRVPLWLKGNDLGWRHPDGRLGEPNLRVPLDGDQAIGAMGLEYSIETPHIIKMRERFEIPPPIVAKGACVLLNLFLTGADEAVLVTNESGRSWPFVDESSAGDATDSNDDNGDDVNPLSIDGPTVTLSVSRNRLQQGETVVQFLARLRQEQHDIEQHSHASIDTILSQLEAPINGATQSEAAADADVVRNTLNRQIFDWLPDVRSAQRINAAPEQDQPASAIADMNGAGGPTKATPSLEMVEVLSRTDLGFVWYPSLKEKEKLLVLNTTWDDAQMRASEVSKAMEQFLCAVRWLSEPENWQRPASQCKFEMEGVKIENVVPERNYRR